MKTALIIKFQVASAILQYFVIVMQIKLVDVVVVNELII